MRLSPAAGCVGIDRWHADGGRSAAVSWSKSEFWCVWSLFNRPFAGCGGCIDSPEGLRQRGAARPLHHCFVVKIEFPFG